MTIEDWLAAIFTAASVPNEEARLISHYLVDADASGHASHGIVRVPRYIDYLENEMVRPVCHSQTLLHQGPLMLMDGQYSFGQVLGHKLIDEATTLVRAWGSLGLVFGMQAIWAALALGQNYWQIED